MLLAENRECVHCNIEKLGMDLGTSITAHLLLDNGGPECPSISLHPPLDSSHQPDPSLLIHVAGILDPKPRTVISAILQQTIGIHLQERVRA